MADLNERKNGVWEKERGDRDNPRTYLYYKCKSCIKIEDSENAG